MRHQNNLKLKQPVLPRLEIAAHSLQSARAAAAGGADRIELCTALSTGGLTPDAGLLHVCLEQLSLPIHVLVRPRIGNFVYSSAEVETMAASIEQIKRIGAHGVVIGCLTTDARIDEHVLAVLLGAAADMHVTFHRAFDYIDDKHTALKSMIESGVKRVLTSGGAPSAWEGREKLQELVQAANGLIEVMPGAGISSQNIEALHKNVLARSYHASAKQLIATSPHAELDLGDGRLPRYETDAGEVAHMVRILGQHFQ